LTFGLRGAVLVANFSPIVEEISEERTDLKVGKLNTDENSETSLKYSILSIPSLLIFQNGKEVKRISGVYPKHKINETINSVLTGGE